LGNGNYDYWVIKLDSLGNIEWQNTIGGNSDDNLISIAHTNDHGYILGGFSVSNISGDKTEGYLGGTDYWVIKLDISNASYNFKKEKEFSEILSFL